MKRRQLLVAALSRLAPVAPKVGVRTFPPGYLRALVDALPPDGGVIHLAAGIYLPSRPGT